MTAAGIKCVQKSFGGLLYYTRAVDNKILVAFSEIGFQQAAANECKNKVITELLDYVANYPNISIIY